MTPDREALKRFFGWIRARHSAWHNRYVEGDPPPWTDDEIVASYFFTNVYRELDPGTYYIRDELPNASGLRQAMFWAMVYRLAFHERSMAALLDSGLLALGTFDRDTAQVRELLRDVPKPFTPAYVVSNYGRSGKKVDIIVDIMQGIARTLRDDWPGILRIDDRQAFHKWCLDNVHGIGRFIAFQAMVDLCYPRTRNEREQHRGWLPWSNDGWVMAGPGAVKGLRILYPDDEAGPANSDELIANLCSIQARYLKKQRYVDRSNMQNCCCEFSICPFPRYI